LVPLYSIVCDTLVLEQDGACQHRSLATYWCPTGHLILVFFHMYIPDEVIFQLPSLLLSVDNNASI
jgi:hypothetical protein